MEWGEVGHVGHHQHHGHQHHGHHQAQGGRHQPPPDDLMHSMRWGRITDCIHRSHSFFSAMTQGPSPQKAGFYDHLNTYFFVKTLYSLKKKNILKFQCPLFQRSFDNRSVNSRSQQDAPRLNQRRGDQTSGLAAAPRFH